MIFVYDYNILFVEHCWKLWEEINRKVNLWRTSLVIQCWRLCAPNAGGSGLIPGQGSKTLHAAQCNIKKKERKKSLETGGIKAQVINFWKYVYFQSFIIIFYRFLLYYALNTLWINADIQYGFFCVWLVLLTIMSVGFIRIAVYGSVVFIFVVVWSSIY